MPIRHKSNNRVLPANQRAVDVAQRAIHDIVPLQQRRYHNAFLVNGYECVVYTSLKQGLACSCSASRKVLSTLLNREGKMPVAAQNELLTSLTFTVDPYGARPKYREDQAIAEQRPISPRRDQKYGGLSSENTIQPPFEIITDDPNNPFADVLLAKGQLANDSVAITDDLLGVDEPFDQFEETSPYLSDQSCGVCFGTGYVGGYSVYNGYRLVLSTQWQDKNVTNGTIEVNTHPFTFNAEAVDFQAMLPKGFISLDRIAVWNSVKQVQGARIYIDGELLNYPLLYVKSDGLAHSIRVEFDEPTTWTHLEFQANYGAPALLEFPKFNQSFDEKKLDGLDNVQINLSPVIPRVAIHDVIVESTFNKAFVVMSANQWNTRDKNMLGWDVEARVIQPTEVVFRLPRRKILQKTRTTNLVRDNVSGKRRT